MREDYSDSGDAWSYLSHDQARSRAYRWGEDGLAGISDDQQRLCLALALWNERDPILKERLFGLTNSEGNHGEGVKEYYFYVDNLPTHSYQRWLYKYPQGEFPYNDLVGVNRARRGRNSSTSRSILPRIARVQAAQPVVRAEHDELGVFYTPSQRRLCCSARTKRTQRAFGAPKARRASPRMELASTCYMARTRST